MEFYITVISGLFYSVAQMADQAAGTMTLFPSLHWPLRQVAIKQVDVGKVVISGSLGGVMVSSLTQNTRIVGSIPALCAIFPILQYAMVAITMIL